MALGLKSYLRMGCYILKIAVKVFGVNPRQCNLCGFHGKFLAAGLPPRFDANCSRCGSLERHRLFGLWTQDNKALLDGKDVLHFAPEAILQRLIENFAKSYTKADLNPREGSIALDIEKIEMPDRSVDVVVCNHVFEHIDHRQGLSELRRILRDDGLLLLTFPIIEGWQETYRNPEVTSPRERDLHFGQWDHIQYFGRDVRKDIEDAGFSLTELTAVEPYVSRHGLIRGEKLFIARCRPQAA